MLIYEDREDIIRCFNPCAGEYYLANSPRLNVDTFYRKFTMSVAQVVAKWGTENVSQAVKGAYSSAGGGSRGAGLTQEVVIAHAIEPNTPGIGSVSKTFAWREVYWEWGSEQGQVLEERGYHEFPALCPRWDIVSNDAYGRSPGMDALADIKQLQQETRRKAQAIDKMVNPPMVADIQLKNQPASLLPGGVTYISGMTSQSQVGFKPAYEVQPRIAEMMQDIQEIQQRIQRIFFNDLFMMFQNLEAEPRSAAAVDVRREEKLIMLGPVLERFQNEALDPAIERTWNIMKRFRILPPPPPEIQGQPIEVSYISMLSEAQKGAATSGIERLFGFAGNLVAVDPEIMDNLDGDEAIASMGDLLTVSPKIIRPKDQVLALRQQRAKAQQAAQIAEATPGMAQAAKNLSQTDVGGGQNAMQQMLGNA
jgi:hypothetical protein